MQDINLSVQTLKAHDEFGLFNITREPVYSVSAYSIMQYKQIIYMLILAGSMLLPVSNVSAHDPGLSRSWVQLQHAGLVLRMVFTRKDLEVLTPMDTDQNGTVTADEFSAVLDNLQSIVMDGVEVRYASNRSAPKSIQVEQAIGDTVNIELYYDYPETSALRVQIPLIAQMVRGHRQILTVWKANGELLAQHILNATSPAILLGKSGPDAFGVLKRYLVEGIRHIWTGFDHILFLLTLLLPAVLVYRGAKWRPMGELHSAMQDTLKIITAFTVAHSITLTLAVLNIVALPPRLVESIIALSVLVTAINNLRPVFPASRWQLAFGFGLVHGFGFANVLIDLGLPRDALIKSLLGFNLGVEAGQLAIVIVVFPIAAFLRHTTFYRTWIFSGGSTVAAMIATVWIFERLFDYEVLGF